MVNALNKKIPESVFEKRGYKRQINLKNPKNIFSINDAYHQRQQLRIMKNDEINEIQKYIF